MTVYILVKEEWDYTYSEFSIVGVYDSEEKAIENKPEDTSNNCCGWIFEIIKKEVE